MSNTRINYLSMYQPDAYGNSIGQNIPQPEGPLGMDVEGSLNSAQGSMAAGEEAAANVAKKAEQKANIGKVGNVAMSLAPMAAEIGSAALKKNKKEAAAGALSGATKGAALGANPALVAATGGLSVAAGAVIGGAIGGLKGHKEHKARIAQEAKDREYKKKLEDMQKSAIGRQEDLAAYQAILSSAKGGVIQYKSGGSLLRYNFLNVKKAQDYLNTLKEENKGGDLRTAKMFRKGGNVVTNDTKLDSIKDNFTPPSVKKKAKKTKKCKKGCACTKCGTKKVTPMFKRGGVLELKKGNVIVDGPSHDQENNTGIKGDRGLPVVKKGIKVAEIESLELVLNSDSSKELETLIIEYKKTNDPSIKQKIADILDYELSHNTYDYSELMK